MPNKNPNLIDRIKQKGANIEEIAVEAINDPDGIADLLAGLRHEKGVIRLGCEKTLRLISEQKPELIYPYFDTFADMLDSDNNLLKWGAIITIANLTAVDSENKFEKIFKKYYALITTPVMITAANIIGSSPRIAAAKPELIEKISKEILRVQKAKYESKGAPSAECSDVAYGHAINSFAQFFDQVENKKPIITFVKKQVNNSRKSVAEKAEKFIKKYQIA